LRAVPVKGLDLDYQSALNLGAIGRIHEFAHGVWIDVRIQYGHPAEDLQPGPARIIHQEQGHPVISGDVSDRDVLAVSSKIGKCEGLFVQNLQKPGAAAAVLYVGPTRFRHAGQIEAVTAGDEVRFRFSQPVMGRWPLFEKGIGLATAVPGLDGLDRRCCGNLQETMPNLA